MTDSVRFTYGKYRDFKYSKWILREVCINQVTDLLHNYITMREQIIRYALEEFNLLSSVLIDEDLF